jgi:protein O-mannosyl-transferase
MLFAGQRALFGFSPLPYHLVSLIAHTAVTGILYQLFCRLLKDRDQSRIGAAIFALHPLHTESVSWISGQMSLFAGLFALLLLYLPLRRSPVWLAALPIITAIGLGFYESFAIAPVLCLILYSSVPHLRSRGSNIRFIIALLLVALSLIGYFYWRFSALELRGGNYALQPTLTMALTNLIYYGYLLLGGSAIGGRILYYQPTQIFSRVNILNVATPLLCALFIFLAVVMARDSDLRLRILSILKPIALLLVWLAIALLPALILPERPRRLSYISVAAFAALVAMGYGLLRNGTQHARTSIGLYLALLAATSFARNQDWNTAGHIESATIELAATSTQCASLVFDTPNLLGDALFFNSLSISSALQQRTGRHVPIYNAQHDLPRSLPQPACFFSYENGRFVPISSQITRRFLKGMNWIP